MKKLFVWLLPAMLFACTRERVQPVPTPHPQMFYSDLHNTGVKFGQHQFIDMNGDNSIDILFSTVLVGDPVLKRDRRQFYINADFDVFLLTNSNEETPVLNNGNAITLGSPAGYNWFNASSVVLAEKIIEETGPDHWEGNWKNASHQYLPVQVRKNDLRYNGWVETSFNTNSGEIILHRAAIAKEAGKDIKAGH
jgi:hypothetical protein